MPLNQEHSQSHKTSQVLIVIAYSTINFLIANMNMKIRLSGPLWLHGAVRTVSFASLLLCLFLLFSINAAAKGYFQQERTITGRVVSSTGEGLSSASVSIKNSSVGTNTDTAGNFTLAVRAAATFVVSYVGYGTQEVSVGPDQTNVVITMDSAGAQLNEVVVIGYGTANRRDLTGSIVKVSGEEIANKPNANLVASLQGRVAGFPLLIMERQVALRISESGVRLVSVL